eukprot:g20438.t1
MPPCNSTRPTTTSRPLASASPPPRCPRSRDRGEQRRRTGVIWKHPGRLSLLTDARMALSVAPAALLILLYLLPGLEVACFREGARAGSRSTGRPSMLESEVSALQATFSMRWSVSSARPLVAEA